MQSATHVIQGIFVGHDTHMQYRIMAAHVRFRQHGILADMYGNFAAHALSSHAWSAGYVEAGHIRTDQPLSLVACWLCVGRYWWWRQVLILTTSLLVMGSLGQNPGLPLVQVLGPGTTIRGCTSHARWQKVDHVRCWHTAAEA